MMNYNKLAAKMLREYSNTLSDNGCNDYVLKDTPENREIAEAFHKWAQKDDPDFPDFTPAGSRIYLYDWMVADWLADMLEKE